MITDELQIQYPATPEIDPLASKIDGTRFSNKLLKQETPPNMLQEHQTAFYCYFNPFVPNASFLYPLKTSENHKIFWCFQGVNKKCIGNEQVKFHVGILEQPLGLFREEFSQGGGGGAYSVTLMIYNHPQEKNLAYFAFPLQIFAFSPDITVITT